MKHSTTSEILEKLKKVNFWRKDQQSPTGYIRKHYLNQLRKYKGNTLIKVLMGQRRAGKSYLLRQMISELIAANVPRKNIFYLNKELLEFEDIATHTDLMKLIELYRKTYNPKGKIYLFLDEVQEIAIWEKAVNALAQNYKEQFEVFITGSNSTMLSSELSTNLSGRYVAFEVLPFQYSEYLGITQKERSKTSLLEYLKSGGLPELFHLPEEEVRRHYLSSLKDTILFKDIVKRYNIKQGNLLESLFRFLLDNIGNLNSCNAISNYLSSHGSKTNVETISSYLGYLTATFLFHEVGRYDVKGKAHLSGAKKYYVNDLSFKSSLFSGFDEGLGRLLENAVYLHLRSQGNKVYVGKTGQYEVDFLAESSHSKQYLQVCATIASKEVAKREFRSLESISDNYEKKLITLDDVSFGEKEGIHHVPAWEFL